MQKTPLAVFAYNRPDHLRSTLEVLRNCHRLNECQIFIFSDGPKTPDQENEVLQTRKVIYEFAKILNAQVVEQASNIGLAHSIVGGVTRLCEEFGRVIVLEDDMLVSPHFLDYMISALDHYQSDDSVCQISGYMFPVDNQSVSSDAFFLALTTTRGWATWKRAWQLFQWDIRDALIELQNPDVRYAFDLEGAYPFSTMLKNCIAGKNNSWGIRWWWSIFKANKVVLHPRHSFVWVGGFDGTGTHSGVNQNMMSLSLNDILAYPWNDLLTFPSTIMVDESARERIKQYLFLEEKPLLRFNLKDKFSDLLKKWKS